MERLEGEMGRWFVGRRCGRFAGAIWSDNDRRRGGGREVWLGKSVRWHAGDRNIRIPRKRTMATKLDYTLDKILLSFIFFI